MSNCKLFLCHTNVSQVSNNSIVTCVHPNSKPPDLFKVSNANLEFNQVKLDLRMNIVNIRVEKRFGYHCTVCSEYDIKS